MERPGPTNIQPPHAEAARANVRAFHAVSASGPTSPRVTAAMHPAPRSPPPAPQNSQRLRERRLPAPTRRQSAPPRESSPGYSSASTFAPPRNEDPGYTRNARLAVHTASVNAPPEAGVRLPGFHPLARTLGPHFLLAPSHFASDESRPAFGSQSLPCCAVLLPFLQKRAVPAPRLPPDRVDGQAAQPGHGAFESAVMFPETPSSGLQRCALAALAQVPAGFEEYRATMVKMFCI